MTALAILDLLVRLLGPADLNGLATYYGVDDHSGNVFRCGESFRLDAPYVAVDDSLWESLQGKVLLIATDDGRFGALTVADSGYLYAAGEFRRVKAGGNWFKPAGSLLVAGPAYRVVVDIPLDMFVEMFGDAETRRVMAWVVE